MKYDIIIYHNADPDGIFSGAIALEANPDAETIGYNYGPEFRAIAERCAGKKVIIVDVSPPDWADMIYLCSIANKVVWIDHHGTAYEKMRGSGILDRCANFYPVFENRKLGACWKVWQFFNPNYDPPPLSIQWVAKYDVFAEYGSENWDDYIYPFRLACSNLDTPHKVLQAEALRSYYVILEKMIPSGAAIAAYVDEENEKAVNLTAYPAEFKTPDARYRVLAINRPLAPDLFKRIDLSPYDFAVSFYFNGENWKVSLRGAGKGIDLARIAAQFGGGGHADAAGFHCLNILDFIG
jgi:hypothetical protein